MTLKFCAIFQVVGNFELNNNEDTDCGRCAIDGKGGADDIKSYHHDPEIAFTPSEALKAVESNPYDAIFMDFGLPEMDGLQLTAHLREMGYSGLVIGLTANIEKFTLEEMKQAGLNTCLEKPFNPKKLYVLDMSPDQIDFDIKT